MGKVFKIIGIIFVGVIVLVLVIFYIISATSNKLVCTSDKGNITIYYNDKTIKAYFATGGITYDLDSQKKYAELIGVKNYMNQFSIWFDKNAGGICQEK